MIEQITLESGRFDVSMTLYKDEPRTTPLQANDEINVPDYIYVTVQLDVDSSNTKFYVQVCCNFANNPFSISEDCSIK